MFKLLKYISIGIRFKFVLAIFIASLSALIEYFSLAMLPFVVVAITGNLNALPLNSLPSVIGEFGGGLSTELVFILFGVLYLVSALMRIFIHKNNASVAFAIGDQLSYDLYGFYLKSLEVTVAEATLGEMIDNTITKVTSIIYNFLLPTFNIISSCILLSAIVFLLLIIDPLSTFIVFGVVGFSYLVISVVHKKKIREVSQSFDIDFKIANNIISESFERKCEILVNDESMYYVDEFESVNSKFRSAQKLSLIIGVIPKYVIEGVGMLLLIAVAISNKSDNLLLAKLAVLAVAAQKIMPLAQQIYSSLSMINISKRSLESIILILDAIPKKCEVQSILDHGFSVDSLKINDLICSKNSAIPCKEINWIFTVGKLNCISGPSGSGKSTLLSAILRFVKPSSGTIYINSIDVESIPLDLYWSYFHYMGQNTYLKNELFVVDSKFLWLAKRLNIENLNGASIVNGGDNLSGGQRQRIALYKALSSFKQIILLDEPTSALDATLQEEVFSILNEIATERLVIVITHNSKFISEMESNLMLS